MDASLEPPSPRSHGASVIPALVTGALLLGAFGGAMAYMVFAGAPERPRPRAAAPAASDSWLGERGAPRPAPQAANAPLRRPGTPLPRPAQRMPNTTLLSADRVKVALYRDGIAPAVVTEFLIGCADCQPHFRYFPKLVPAIQDAGFQVTHVAFRGSPGGITHFQNQHPDYGGQVFIDHQDAIQRHFGIGTFTVWLLDEDGTIRFQGSPADAEPHLADHLARRTAQRDAKTQ